MPITYTTTAICDICGFVDKRLTLIYDEEWQGLYWHITSGLKLEDKKAICPNCVKTIIGKFKQK